MTLINDNLIKSITFGPTAPTRVEGFCPAYYKSARSYTVNTSSGIITSPNYPNMIPLNAECVWKIVVADGKRVKFVINTLDLWCDYAFLELRDGPGSTSSSLGQYCGVSQPKDIYTTGRYLWVRFHSGRKVCVNTQGFQASFVAVDKELAKRNCKLILFPIGNIYIYI